MAENGDLPRTSLRRSHDNETGMLLCFELRHDTHTASRRGRPVLEVVGGRTQARAAVGTGVLTHMGLENIISLVGVSTDLVCVSL